MIILKNIIYTICFICGYAFLNNSQLKSIGKILEYNTIYTSLLSKNELNKLNEMYLENHNKTFSDMVYETRKILFQHSLPFVHSKYKSFTKSSIVSNRLSYSERNIVMRYGYMGLWKAIRKFNGTSNFYKYSDIYISSEFKRALSDLNTNYILPHRFRINKEFLKTNNMSNFRVTSFSHIDENYDKSLESKFKNYCTIQTIEMLYAIIQSLTPKERSYFTYRYNIYTCKIQRTNKEVAHLMCVSEETARKEILRVTKLVIEMILTF